MLVTTRVFRLFPLAALGVLVGCSGAENPAASGPRTASARVLNATNAPLTITIDGEKVARTVPASTLSELIAVAPGAHSIRLEAQSAVTVDANVADGGMLTAIAVATSPSSFSASAFPDTGARPVAGKSKLRVMHLAASAQSVDIWRTQPDYQTLIRVQFPFPFQATSPYLQSDPGDWEVKVTPTTDWNTFLASSGKIAVGSGEVVTVALVDSAGFLRFRVLRDE